MLLRKEKEKNSLFLVSCADWEMAIKASDAEEACTGAIEKMLDEFGKGVKVSPVMLSFDFSGYASDANSEDATKVLSSASILANAGHHKWAKGMNSIFGE